MESFFHILSHCINIGNEMKAQILSIFCFLCDISLNEQKFCFSSEHRKRLVVLVDCSRFIHWDYDILSFCFSLHLLGVVFFFFFIVASVIWLSSVLSLTTHNYNKLFSILLKSIFAIVSHFHKLVLLVISFISFILSLFSVTF